MEERHATISHSEVLDGVLVVSNNWKILSAATVFNLFPSIKAKNLDPGSFKGVRFQHEDQAMYKVPLGLYQTQFTVNLVVGAPDNHINVDDFGKHILSYFFRAVANMPNSLTCTDWEPKPDNQKRTVFLTDVAKVGNRVLDLIRREQPELNIYLVVVALGQSCPFDRLNQITRDFEMRYCSQLIVHFAYDFLEEDQSLFFSREKLRNLLGKRNLQSEYFVCLLKGRGNFYFNVGHLASPPNWKFFGTKFYSEAFKSFHRNSGTQFKYPEICYMLMDPRDFSKGFANPTNKLQFAPKLSSVRNVQQLIQKIGMDTMSLKARFEIIIRLEGEDIFHPAILIPATMSEHLQLNPQRLKECIARVNTLALGHHIRRHLSPFLGVMDNYLSTRIEAQTPLGLILVSKLYNVNSKPITLLDLDGYINLICFSECFLNCIASEAITAFTLFGNVYYRDGRYLYPTWLTKALKIGRSDYKYKHQREKLWLFDTVRRVEGGVQFLCPGFQLTPILQKIRTRCRLDEKYIQLFVQLEAFGNLISEEQCSVEFNNLILSLAELLVVSSVEASAHKLLPRLPRNYHGFSFLRKLRCLKGSLRPGMTTIIDTQEFVENVFLGHYASLSFITWLCSIAEFLIKDCVDQLKLTARNYLEEQLLELGSFLVVPAQDNEYIAVAPFSGTQAENFSNLPLGTKLSLIDDFQFFYPPALANEDLMQILSRDWNNRRIWEMILEIGDVALL